MTIAPRTTGKFANRWVVKGRDYGKRAVKRSHVDTTHSVADIDGATSPDTSHVRTSNGSSSTFSNLRALYGLRY